ncbi:MAG TPA: hypothetical protein VLW53_11945 [Candidatus Eisenbacteria bacterium]|nr:hypothetical protein [Candidatus Eisenbacteria bacterium]
MTNGSSGRAALSTVVAAASILTLLGLRCLEVRTPPAITVSALALIPTLVTACLLPDMHVAAVLLVAAACQGALVLTEDLTPATAEADSAAAFLAAGVRRLAAYCISLLWADHVRLGAVEEVTEAALAGRPPEDTLRSAALRATRLLRGDLAAVVLEGERGDRLTVVAAAGPGAGRSGSGTVRPRVRRIGESVAATASLVILHAAAHADRKRSLILDKLEVARRSEAAAHCVRHVRP